jgi:predicted nucleotidyltransferase
MGLSNMKRERILSLIKEALARDGRTIFAYAYGSFVKEEAFRDIDIGIYIKNPEENIFVITSDLRTELSRYSREEGVNLTADQFDVKVINDAPFTFLNRIFKEGKLLMDLDPDLRTDLIEHVSVKYRECAGLLAEASL